MPRARVLGHPDHRLRGAADLRPEAAAADGQVDRRRDQEFKDSVTGHVDKQDAEAEAEQAPPAPAQLPPAARRRVERASRRSTSASTTPLRLALAAVTHGALGGLGAAGLGRRRSATAPSRSRTGASRRSVRGTSSGPGIEYRGLRHPPGLRQRALAPRVRRLRRLRRRAAVRALDPDPHRAEGADRRRGDGGDRAARRRRVPRLRASRRSATAASAARRRRPAPSSACARSSTSRSSERRTSSCGRASRRTASA